MVLRVEEGYTHKEEEGTESFFFSEWQSCTHKGIKHIGGGMVFNVTFNNISVISLRSYFGVEQKFKMDISHGQSLYCSFMGTSLSSLGEALKRMN